MIINKIFENILDIPGVDGACLFSTNGQILINSLPAFFSSELMATTLRRISALYMTMDENFIPCDDYLLRFADKWVCFRRSDQSVLLVMATPTANFTSVRMATNMAMKQLTPKVLFELTLTQSPAAEPEANVAPVAAVAKPVAPAKPVAVVSPAPVVAPEPVAPPKPTRSFRGSAY
jgi:hypothetical protein